MRSGRAIVETAVWAVLLWGMYAVSISTVTALESGVGAGAALLAGAAATALRRTARARTGSLRALPRALLAWPVTLLADTAALCAAVLGRRPPDSRFRAVRLGRGAPWAAAVLTSTPGSYAVAVDEEGTAETHVLKDRQHSLLERTVSES